MPTERTLVDSNVLIDLLTEDPQWFDWSSAALTAAADEGLLLINPLVYAEVSIRFTSIEDLDDALSPNDFVRTPLPWSAAFLAGKCFADYRRRGGTKPSPLPDFYIGAHAAVSKFSLLTRDTARYRTYFPTVDLICPGQPS
ncbi:type II toxin-antitoxin system VapC family toxin [Kibdelosporangium philippinense]|uniref:Type II toxin-antitoxin system VapC family toxin n=1 Tax=Kibdelosporangium philippinense TaxID=211113 RepID=A0ABS8ZHF0_9PSEU|nr:type II toxin-antitoxin system VapC family toxin [Kibdelosporangium philippinense]MCE7005913.1 type II toxin-antitoxin system VapC family toxin [Kibdelosporangium philippinense]